MMKEIYFKLDDIELPSTNYIAVLKMKLDY